MTTNAANSCLAQPSHDPGETVVWSVVPVKLLSESKQRLHSCLGARREEFTLAMLEDLLNALADSRLVDGVACVTADPKVAALASHRGALVVDEKHPLGMNEAIALGIDAARRHGGERIVVLPADLPLASGAEIDRLLGALEAAALPGEPAVIGLSPAADGCGTNFLSLEADHTFETHFGRDSYQQHQAHAVAEGFRTLLLGSPTLSFDIDCERDLLDLISYCARHPEYQRTHSWRYLRQIGLAGEA